MGSAEKVLVGSKYAFLLAAVVTAIIWLLDWVFPVLAIFWIFLPCAVLTTIASLAVYLMTKDKTRKRSARNLLFFQLFLTALILGLGFYFLLGLDSSIIL